MPGHRALEDGGGQVVVDALALVGDVDEHAVAAVGAAHADRRRTRAVAQRVLDDGGQFLGERTGRGQHRPVHVVAQHEGAPGRLEGRPPLVALLGEDLAQVQGLGGAPAGAARDLEQVLHDAGQALHLLDAGMRLVAHLLVVGQQLDLLQAQAQAGQGRAQLVGGVRGELALGGQAPGHALGGADELGLDQVDLLDAGAAQAGADLAAAQLLGLGREVDQRGGDAPRGRRGDGVGRRQRHEREDDDGQDDGEDHLRAVLGGEGGAEGQDHPGPAQGDAQQHDGHRDRTHCHLQGSASHPRPPYRGRWGGRGRVRPRLPRIVSPPASLPGPHPCAARPPRSRS